MAWNAYVFGRPAGAVIAGFPYGHVGFGFAADQAGSVLVGGAECSHGRTSHVDNAMEFWTHVTDRPDVFMSSTVPYGRGTRYDMCKIIPVANGNVAAAQAQIDRIAQTDYNLGSQNCRTDTIQILEAYGVAGFMGTSIPSKFFGHIPVAAIPLVAPWPGLAVDVSFYTETDQYGLRDDPDANAQGYVADPAADERADGLDGPAPVIASILLRRGHLALFSEQNYRGNAHFVPLGRVFNWKDVPWADTQVRSWYASAEPFDAGSIAQRADGIEPRSASTARRGLPPHFAPEQQREALRLG